MNCPICPSTALVMTDRSGIEIDYCPSCRGVWLDRGELDKIIERSAAAAPVPIASAPADRSYKGDRYRDDRSYKDDRYRDDKYAKKRKSGLLGELFDF